MTERHHTTATLAAPESRLQSLRGDILQLHKALLDYEQRAYEQLNGRVESSGKLFELILHHPRFAWLRTFSSLVVTIDELLESDDPVTESDVKDVIQSVRATAAPSETGSSFQKRYFTALQHDPGVVYTHGALMKSLAAATKPSA